MNPIMEGVMGVAQAALDARYADSARDKPDSAAQTVSGESSTGWDPREVWLRRIEQPRRRRTVSHRALESRTQLYEAGDPRLTCTKTCGTVVNRKRFLAGALSVSVGLVGCNTPQTGAGSSQVEVEASFRERLALAPGVRLEASLLDISRADAPAAIVGKTVLEDVGQPPYRFTIAHDPAAIVTSQRYAVRVVLMKDTRLLFTTDQVYPVLTGGSPASVQVLLKRVDGGQ